VLPSVIGRTIGGMISGAVDRRADARAAAEAAARQRSYEIFMRSFDKAFPMPDFSLNLDGPALIGGYRSPAEEAARIRARLAAEAAAVPAGEEPPIVVTGIRPGSARGAGSAGAAIRAAIEQQTSLGAGIADDPNKGPMPVDEVGWAYHRNDLDRRYAGYMAGWEASGGQYDVYDHLQYLDAFDLNYQMIDILEARAAPVLARADLEFSIMGGPIAAMTLPLVAPAAGSAEALITLRTLGILAVGSLDVGPLHQENGNGSSSAPGTEADRIRREMRATGTAVAAQGSGAPDPNRNEAWDPESRDLLLTSRDLQHNWRRAESFGVRSNWSKAGEMEFREALNSHVKQENTIIIRGEWYRRPAVHYYNPATGLNVTARPNGTLWTSARLTPDQVRHLLQTGRLGGR